MFHPFILEFVIYFTPVTLTASPKALYDFVSPLLSSLGIFSNAKMSSVSYTSPRPPLGAARFKDAFRGV